jgi:hypothetical protein
MKRTVGEWARHIDDLLAIEKEISEQFKKSIVAVGEALLDAKSELSLDEYNGMMQLSGLSGMSRSDIGDCLQIATEERQKRKNQHLETIPDG